MVDAHNNFAYSTVATAPSPATSGVSLVVTAGQGVRFPTPPFNATVWPAGAIPDPTNAEIVRVTAIATDTFTITRAQEGSTARAIAVGDQMAAALTAGLLDQFLPLSGGTTTGNVYQTGPHPYVDAKAYGVVWDGVTDDTTALQNAVNACPTLGTVILPIGTGIITQLTINKSMRLIGQGQAYTVLKAKTGATGPLLNVAPTTNANALVLNGFEVNLTNAPTIIGVQISTVNSGLIERIRITGGSKGLNLIAVASTVFRDCQLRDQTTAMIYEDGDTCGEVYYEDLDLRVETVSVTCAAAIEINRTTATDVGGHYMMNVRQTRGPGTLTNALYAHSTATNSAMFLVATGCVFDNTSSDCVRLSNMNEAHFVNCWFNGSGYALNIAAGSEFTVDSCHLDCTNGGLTLASAPANMSVRDCFVERGILFTVTAGVGNAPTGLWFAGNDLEGAATLANDLPTLALTTPATQVAMQPPAIQTHSAGGGTNALKLVDAASGGGQKWLRVSGTTLQILNSAFSVAILQLQDTGYLGLNTLPTYPFHVVNTVEAANNGTLHVGLLNNTVTSTSLGTTQYTGLNATVAVTNNQVSTNNNLIYGIQGVATYSGSSVNGNQIRGLSFAAQANGTGQAFNCYAVFGAAQNLNSGGIGGRLAGLDVIVQNTNATATIANVAGVYVERPTSTAGSTITNTYGVYIELQTPTAGTLTNAAFGLYSAHTGGHYLAGDLRIGVTTLLGRELLRVNGDQRIAGVYETDLPSHILEATNRTAATIAAIGAAARTITSPTAATNVINAQGVWTRISTAATNASIAKIEGSFAQTRLDNKPVFITLVELSVLTAERVFIGLVSATFPAAETLATITAAAFRYSTGSSDTTWQCVTSNATAQTVANSGITVAANTRYVLKIDLTDPANIRFFINGALVATNTATLPAATTSLGMSHDITALAAAQKDLDFAWVRLESL